MSTILRDFQPYNRWTPKKNGEKWEEDNSPKYLIDQSTGRLYLNESKGVVRFKCFLLTVGTPFVHSIAGICNIALRIFRLVTFYHLRRDKPEEKSYAFTARLGDAVKDLLRVVIQPIAIFGLELSAIYGLFRPYDGRKLYASIERAQYGNFILAPCFQPDPKAHALGGDINKKNQF